LPRLDRADGLTDLEQRLQMHRMELHEELRMWAALTMPYRPITETMSPDLNRTITELVNPGLLERVILQQEQQQVQQQLRSEQIGLAEPKVCPKCKIARRADSYLTKRGHRCHNLSGKVVARCHVCRSRQSALAAQTRRVRAAATGSYWTEKAQQRALHILGLFAVPADKRRKIKSDSRGATPSLVGSVPKIKRYKRYLRTIAGIKRPTPRSPEGLTALEIKRRYQLFLSGEITREEYETLGGVEGDRVIADRLESYRSRVPIANRPISTPAGNSWYMYYGDNSGVAVNDANYTITPLVLGQEAPNV
jgi:hypothetical protein